VKTLVKLYTRKGCHLCENAEAIVMELQEKWDFQYKEEDIDRSDELTEKYGLMIPVVEIDGEEVQFGQIDKNFINEALSRKLLS
jgi:glutaredoxin